MKTFSKILLLLAVTLLVNLAYSQPRSVWAFYDVKLSEIVRIGLSQLLNQSFVADDALIRDERRVTLDLKIDQADKAGPVLIDLLLDAGYKVTQDDGLWKIRKLTDKDKENDNETLIYRPRYRPASYFYDVLGIGKNRSAQESSYAGQGWSSNRANFSAAGQSDSSATGRTTPESASQYIDRTSDVVFLKASPREIEHFARIIKSLDQPIEQVDVAAVVYEYQVSEGEQTALGAVFKLAGKLSGQVGAVQAVGDFLRLDASNLQILLSILAEDKRFQLISNPNLRANSGTSSRISVGADVPTLSSTTSVNGTVTQSVSYQKTGVILEVQPNVYQNAIEMKVRQTVSEAISTNTGVNNSPTLTTRELTTNITMHDGEAVVLGGLTSTRVTDAATGLSFLPKFLRSKSNTNDRTELLVFLRVAKAAK